MNEPSNWFLNLDKNAFNSPSSKFAFDGKPPSQSYLYQQPSSQSSNYIRAKSNYLFPPSQADLDESALGKSIQIGKKTFHLTTNGRNVVFFEGEFLDTIQKVYEKIKIPKTPEPEFMKKIAKIAIFLLWGSDYKCKTTKLTDAGLVVKAFKKDDQTPASCTVPFPKGK